MNLPIEHHRLTVSNEQLARQATASLGGHLFQAVRTAIEWITLSEEASLLVEVAEDYAVLVGNALNMTQAKHEFGSSVTLRSDGVRKSLAGLVAFQETNPALKVTLAYLTTAEPGRENGSGLPAGTTGIAYWRAVARGADIAPLRQLLMTTQNDKEVLRVVREADDDTLRTDIVQRVKWLTESPDLAAARATLTARLRALGVERTGYANDGERALAPVLLRILQTAVANDRVLTRDDFIQEWDLAATASISISALRQMATLGGAGHSVVPSDEPPLPTLSARTAPRHALVDDLCETVRSADVLWLHGSSGLGKSQLARLITARDGGRWAFVSLGGCDEQQRELRVQSAVARIAREDFAGMVLDDLPVPMPERLRSWVAAASLEIAETPAARIVVTAERAPLPQVRKAFEPLRMEVRNAPYLEHHDVMHIVSAAGGDPDRWATPVHLACGGGHPLLVDARVAGLASRGWPEDERLNGLGFGGGASEIADARREVSLRLLEELATDAHQLLLRLSGLIGAFDQQLVGAIAAIEPAIPRALPLLGHLTGPWVEQQGTDRYRLSPLLADSSAALDKAERANVHTAAIEDLIGRNPFPSDLLFSLILYTMNVRSTEGFKFIGAAVIDMPRPAQFSSELFPLTYMESSADGLLVPGHPGVSAVLRTAQVIAAVNTDPPRMLEKIVEEASREFARLPTELRDMNMLATHQAVLSNSEVNLAPRVWMPMLVSYHDSLVAGQLPAEMADAFAALAPGEMTSEQLFFVARSNKVETVAAVEELLDELETVQPEWRHALLTAGPRWLGGAPLFVQKGWSSEISSDTFDATRAVAAYERMTSRAIAWEEEEIAIECVRSHAVLLDEYLERSEDALAVLDDADERFGKNDRLIRSRATVLSSMGRHVEELELLSTLGAGYSADEPLERLMMLRVAAISAAKVGRFEQSAQLFHEAYEVATKEALPVLKASVRPGLLADAAVMEVQGGCLGHAVGDLAKSLEMVTQGLSDDQSLEFLRAAIRVVTLWATARVTRQPFADDLSESPGMCSNLNPQLDADQGDPRRLNQELYWLARLEVLAGVDSGVLMRLHECELTDGVQPRLATGTTMVQMQHHTAKRDAGAVLSLLPRYAWLFGLHASAAGNDVVRAVTDQISPANWREPEIFAARAAVSGVMGMLVADGRLDDAVDAARQAREMSSHLDALLPEAQDELIESPDLFADGIAAFRLLGTEKQFNSEQLLRASIELFVWLKQVGVNELSERAHCRLAASWLDLVRNRRFLLSTPRLSVPAIENAAAATPDICGIARLIEASRIASSFCVPAPVVKMLNTTQ